MFGLSSKREKLQKSYEKLMQESYRLSSVNRVESDTKAAEAAAILERINAIENNQK